MFPSQHKLIQGRRKPFTAGFLVLLLVLMSFFAGMQWFASGRPGYSDTNSRGSGAAYSVVNEEEHEIIAEGRQLVRRYRRRRSHSLFAAHRLRQLPPDAVTTVRFRRSQVEPGAAYFAFLPPPDLRGPPMS